MITASMFLAAFERAWQYRATGNDEQRRRLADCYGQTADWTTYMLASDPSAGLLADVARNLRQQIPDLVYHGREIYTLDAVFASDDRTSDLIGRAEGGYPSKLYALIEHENGEWIEEEMWKLLWWRAPLKVIICYDYLQAERDANVTKANWLADKLAKLAGMHQRVNAYFGENSSTQYLVLAASRQGYNAGAAGDDIPTWCYALLPDTRLSALC